MSQSVTFNKKTGCIERMDLKIYPEELTLQSSSKGSIQLLDAIREALIKDHRRAIQETKELHKNAEKLGKKISKKAR